MSEYDKETVAERQKARTNELTDKLESGMKDLYNSDKYKDYLKSMSHFHNYSSRNIMLIYQQMPNATKIASFKIWKEKFNRNVKKGETGLYIYAPIAGKYSETKLMEKIDKETGAPLLDKDGKVIMEEMTALTNEMKFKLVPVFDYSQTHGDPIPELAENITGNVTHYEAFLETLKAVSPLPIVFEPMRADQDGYCRFGDKIGIRDDMSEAQTVSAIIHEMTYARLHDTDTASENTESKTKRLQEIESESIAYIICQRYQIETSPNSFGYLAEYGSRDMSELTASLDTIRKEANIIITLIDERFGIICKERGIDLTVKEPDREDDIIMPDSAIGFSEMTLYGYTAEGILPLTAHRATELFNEDHTIYLLYSDNTEAMAFSREEIESHDGIFGIEREEWINSKEYTVLSAQNIDAVKESDLIHGNADTFAIYQLKDTDEMRDYRFESIESLEKRGLAVDRDNYLLAYTAPLLPADTLDSIYQQFNLDRPKDFTGYSLSVSDVIVIQRDGEVSSHYVDSFAFTELPAFLGAEKQPIYMFAAETAIQNGDIDVFRQSMKLNAECGQAIDKAITDSNYELYHYDLKTATKTVIDDFGVDRVSWVLAANINYHDFDGRLSNANKAWAKEFDTPKPDYYLKTHLTILDGFADRFREAAKPSLLDTLNKNEQKSKQQFSHTSEHGNDKSKKSNREGYDIAK
jgi:hypothetical protein